MKKTLLALFLVLTALVLVGCNKTSVPTTVSRTTAQKSIDPYWDKDGNGIADYDEEEITLTYATWQWHEGETTIDTLLIQAFEEEHPNINVEMVYVGESYEWDTKMSELMETGLPDVFLVNRLETYLGYNVLADISEQYAHDEDAAYIFDSLKTSGEYDGKRYAVPTFIYANWWFVNLDMLSDNGIAVPSYDWTWDQMEAISKACYNETTHDVGQSGYTDYWKVLPKVLKADESWASYTFDGTKFNFDSQAFTDSMDKLTASLADHSVSSPYSIDQIYEYFNIQKDSFAIDNGYNIGFDGHAAIWSSPSWCAKDYFDEMLFNWDVYPAPGGTIGGNTDLASIYSNCQHKDAAYQLLKWMSFGKQGLETRYEFIKDYKDMLFVSANNYPYPVANYGINTEGVNEIWDNLPYDDKPGMTSSEMISAIRNGAFVLNKEVPGWDAVDEAVNPYLYQIAAGEATWNAVKQTVIEGSVNKFREANDLLKAAIKANNQ